MEFTRVGNPLLPVVIKEHPGCQACHTPPFPGGLYCFVPGYEEIFLVSGTDKIQEKGFFKFNYSGACYAHRDAKRGTGGPDEWIRFESVDSDEFLEFVVNNFHGAGEYYTSAKWGGDIYVYDRDGQEIYLDTRSSHKIQDVVEIDYQSALKAFCVQPYKPSKLYLDGYEVEIRGGRFVRK